MESTRTSDQRLGEILDAIARARVADKRMRLGESLGDAVGVQVAYQAILHNLTVIGEAVASLPADLLARDPETPWHQVAALADVTVRNYQLIPSDDIHSAVDDDLASLDVAVRRLRTKQ